MNKTVVVIIPTYNRYKNLLNAIKSVREQTYPQKLIKIIVINDGSTEKYGEIEETYISLGNNCSRKILGYGHPGFSRNVGLKLAESDYIAFLDDDDIWLPKKLEIQIKRMEEEKIDFSCTEGLHGSGIFNSDKKYLRYNEEKHKAYILNKLSMKKYPTIFDKETLIKHNFAVTSSVVISSVLAKSTGLFIEKEMNRKIIIIGLDV